MWALIHGHPEHPGKILSWLRSVISSLSASCLLSMAGGMMSYSMVASNGYAQTHTIFPHLWQLAHSWLLLINFSRLESRACYTPFSFSECSWENIPSQCSTTFATSVSASSIPWLSFCAQCWFPEALTCLPWYSVLSTSSLVLRIL